MNISRRKLSAENYIDPNTRYTLVEPVEDPITLTCDDCSNHGHSCSECIVGVLLGAEPETTDPPVLEEQYRDGIRLDDVHRDAIDALADAGMIPRLTVLPLEGRAAHRTPMRSYSRERHLLAG